MTATPSSDISVQVRESAAWTRRLLVTVPAGRVKQTRGRIAAEIAKRAKLSGFRSGKLPGRMVEQRYGPLIEQETVDRVVKEAYPEALEQSGFRPVSEGKVENVRYQPGTDTSFEVEFDVRPEPELARLGGFAVTRPAPTVSAGDVSAVIDRLRDEQALWRPLEDSSPGPGDKVRVDIVDLDEGKTEPRSYEFVLGEGQAIPEVEGAITTLRPGRRDQFQVRFPDDFPDREQQGAERRMEVHLVAGSRKELPELDDAFAQSVGTFEDLAALEARVKEDLEREAAQSAESELRSQLVECVLEANPFELPAGMVERYLDGVVRDGDKQLSDDDLARRAEVRERLRPGAEWSLKRTLVIDQIAGKEGLGASREEVDVRVEELAAKHGRQPSELWVRLEKSGQLDALEREITESKVFDYLKSQSTVKEST
ncbi:MAG: trigger factor [Longimicrobiaceae bacterium]